jgi:agmatinase
LRYGGPFEGSKFHHGGPFRQAVLAGVLDPERTIQIGVRGGAEYLWEFSYASGMTVIHAEELQREGLARTIDKIRKVVATAPPTFRSTSTASIRPLRPAPERRRSAV